MSGGSATGAIYPPDLQSAKEQVEACFSKGNEYKAEYRIRKKDGSLMWVMDSGRKFTDATGATKINSILTDITSLKNTVEQLRLAQSRYQIALGSITSVLFEYDFKEDSLKYIFHEGNQVDETRRESTLLNFKESLFSLGQVHKDGVERAWNVFSGKEKEAQVRVTRFLMKNDGWYWVVISSALFCDSAGEPVRTIGTIKDVTLEGDDKGQKKESAMIRLPDLCPRMSFSVKLLKCSDAFPRIKRARFLFYGWGSLIVLLKNSEAYLHTVF